MKMNRQEAKEILSLYRPGTADADDSSFAPALRLCEDDPELKQWFEQHCTVYEVLRNKLKQITVPDALKEQILAERKVHVQKVSRRPAVIGGALVVAALALIAVVVSLLLPPRDDRSLVAYREQMVTKALRFYAMDVETDKMEKVRTYLASVKAKGDFVLPNGLQSARLTGCAAITWHGRPVSMICFDSGRPHPPGTMISDLWLFVTDRKSVPQDAVASSPVLSTVNSAITATWTANDQLYVLVAEGDEALIKKYL
jgi:hypothetical protein